MAETYWSNRESRQKFYSSKDWRALREYVLAMEPLCRKCKLEGYNIPAEVVDHIIDIVDDPDKALDINNLQPLCKSCHDRKTFSKTLKTNNVANENRKKIRELNLFKRKWKI